MEYACEIIGLVERFGPKTAVDQLTIRVPMGMLYGFLGVRGHLSALDSGRTDRRAPE
jgi:ABC-type multidrug transport system ATPase subunit